MFAGLFGKNHLGCRSNISYVPRGWHEHLATCDVHFSFGGTTGLPNLALMANGTMIGRLYDTPEFNIAGHVGNITELYTSYAVDFIHQHANEPFFLFYTPDSTHGPTFSAPQFSNTSRRGPYGDSLNEVRTCCFAHVGSVLFCICVCVYCRLILLLAASWLH